MENKIKAVVFDWAGTTIDFGCFAPLNVFLEIFKKKGVEITLAEAREPMGMLKCDHIRVITQMPRVADAWKALYGKVPNKSDIDELYADFEPSLMAILPNFCDVLDGVLETCKLLREQNIKIGSTTGYTKEMMTVVTNGANQNGYAPDFLVTADDVGHGRPYPYMLFRNMQEFSVYPPCSVIKVGDTVSDILEGKNAGVISVGVVVGSSVMGLSRTDWDMLSALDKEIAIEKAQTIFKQAGADYIINDMTQLPSLIKELEV